MTGLRGPGFLIGFCLVSAVQGAYPRLESSFRAVGQIFAERADLRSHSQIAFDENYEHGTEKNALTLVEAGVKVTLVEYVREREAFLYGQNRSCTPLSTRDLELATDIQVVKRDKSGQHVFPIRQLLSLPDQYLLQPDPEEETFLDVPAQKWTFVINATNVRVKIQAFWSTGATNTPSATKLIPLGFIIQRNTRDSNLRWNYLVQRVELQLFTQGEFYFRAFRPRRGIFCPGRKDPEPFLNLTALGVATLHAKMETVVKDFQREGVIDMFFDPSSLLYRIDFMPMREAFPREVKQIFSLKQGVVYEISGSSRRCTVRRVGELPFDPETIFDPRKEAGFTLQDWLGTEKTNYMAVGEDAERGIPCVVYHGLRQDWPPGQGGRITTLWEWCVANTLLNQVTFPEDGLPFISLNIYVTESPFGLAGESAYYKGLKMTYNFYDVRQFSALHLEHLAFDIGECFQANNQERLRLTASVPDELRSVLDKSTLSLEHLSTWRAAILEAAKVSAGSLRLSDLQARLKDDLEVTFTLLGRHPDLAESSGEMTLAEAVANLQIALDGNKIMVNVQTDPKDSTKLGTLQAKPGSLVTLRDQVKPKDPTPGDNKKKPGVNEGVNGGAMAGMALGMLALGVALGSGVIFIKKRRTAAGH